MIPELNQGERRGNTVSGAGEEGVYTGLAGRMVGEGSGLWERTYREGVLRHAVTAAGGACGRPGKRSQRGMVGISDSEKPKCPWFSSPWLLRRVGPEGPESASGPKFLAP